MSISKFALDGLRTALALGLAPISFAWAQAAGAPLGTIAAAPAGAMQGQTPVVYRCPGPPVLYTDTLSPQEARGKNCKPLTDLPVAVAPPAPKPAPIPAPVPPSGQGTAAAGSNLGATGSTSPVGTATAGSAAAPAASGAGFVTPPPGGSRIGASGAAGNVPSSASAGSAAGAAGVVGAGPVAGVALPDTRIRPDDQRTRDAEARRILEAELRREEARLNEAIKASGTAKPGERAAADAAQIRRAESDIEAIRRELGRLR